MDYMVRIGISSRLNEKQLEEVLEEILGSSSLLYTICEVVEDDNEGSWALAHERGTPK